MATAIKTHARRAMQTAGSYEEWRRAAQRYDDFAGHSRWKAMDQSREFDFRAIRQRLESLRAMRDADDVPGLLFALNEGIHGNMGGMGRPELYQRARFGTKQLIVDYVDEIVAALERVAAADGSLIELEEKLDFLRRAHHCFGESALMMSGSGTLLYFHIGVTKALWEQDLLPPILSGSSGGSLVGSILATHTDAELAPFFDAGYLSRHRHARSPMTLLQRIRQPFLSVTEVKAMIAQLVPDLTFQQAYELTGRHMNISISPAEAHQTSRLLNAMTSPNVLMRDAVLASCAVPGIYPPVRLSAQDRHGNRIPYLPGRRWVDGAVSDDLPAKRLARLYGVNHFIVSQTNPHVIPFISDTRRRDGVGKILRTAATRTTREWINAGATIFRRPLARRPKLHRLTNIVLSVLNQDYVGDINILPPYRFYNPARLLAHLGQDEIASLIAMGERAAWPKLEMVRIQTRIGRNLDRLLDDCEATALHCAHDMRTRAASAHAPQQRTSKSGA